MPAIKAAHGTRAASLTAKICATAFLFILIMAGSLMLVMTYFMDSLTNRIILETLQPIAKTTAQSIEESLHTLVVRFYMVRDNTVITSSESTNDQKRQVLERILSGIEFTWIGLYNSGGQLIAGSQRCPANISGRELFASIKATGNLAIADTSLGSVGPEITMGLPLNRADAGPSYLVGGYNYEVLSDILYNIHVGTNGMAFIINGQSLLIAHVNMDKVFRRESAAEILGFAEDDAKVLFRAMTEGQTRAMEISGDGDDRIFVSFAPIRGTLWYLGIQAPRSDFTAAAKQAQAIGSAITFGTLIILSIFLTIFIRRILSAPLKKITDNAGHLADGEFGMPLPPEISSRRDEIGQLGAAFFSMSNSIQGMIQDIGRLTGEAMAGRLGERSDFTSYQGDYRLILSGINATLDVFCSHLDIIPGALMFLDKDHHVLYRNEAMDEFLKRHGISKDVPRILPAISGAHNKLPPEAAILFETQDGKGKSYKANVTLKDTAGEECNYDLSLWRVDGGGAHQESWNKSPVCVMLILNDVTQLIRARIDAEAASRSKSDFLSRMSHEIRTPMNAIIGMTSIGKSSDDITRKEYCLTRISEASQHLLGIINDILDMSKIEVDKFELSFVECSFEKILQLVINVINFRVDEKKQKLIVDIDKNIPPLIITDDQRLAQVVTNLISNAVKFTPDGGAITLLAEKKAETAETCTILVEVKDTGIGISEEQQKRLFTPFEQADGGISRKYGGTGLGLVISKRIIELMGGELWVKSEPEKGSSFFFQIEARIGKGARDETQQDDKAPLAGVRCEDLQGEILAKDDKTEEASIDGIFNGKQIMIAEDVDINREIIGALLESTEVKIEFAFDGEEAVAKFTADPFKYELVLMDLHMPKVDGYEATRRIRSSGLPTAATLPIIAMTANVFREDIEKCLACGMNDHLGKPVNPDDVIATLSHYLLNKSNA